MADPTPEQRAAEVVHALDALARDHDHDHYEYGLPVYNDAMLATMTGVVADAIRTAEEVAHRRGAEEMREQAAQVADAKFHYSIKQAEEVAAAIRALPVGGKDGAG